MIDKTMCEVLWRNISDFYVNLRVEVGKHPQVILAMYFLSWTRIMSVLIAVADLEGGVRGVRPPKIRKAYVIQR